MNVMAPVQPDNFWMRGRPTTPAVPSLRGDVHADIAIVGAGYTGLSTAYAIKLAEPSLRVAMLEAETVGYGASGRNAGFVMSLFGASAGLMKTLHGKDSVREAHAYMGRAINALEETIKTHDIDCDFVRGGFLKVATSPTYVSRIKQEIEFFQSLGIDDLEWLDRGATAQRVDSPTYLGACLERQCGLIHPIKWVDGLRALALQNGVTLYENTRVASVERLNGKYRVSTAEGSVVADKVIYATNGYSHLLPNLKYRQTPAFAYIIVTKQLTSEQRAAIGWQGSEGVEDGRNFMHFYRLTPDGRLLVGGGPGLVPYGGNLDHDTSPKAWAHLEQFIGKTFPALRGIPIEHRWGGAFSVTSDSTPHISTLDGGGIIYSVGCTGHGVALTHMNGRIIRDLALDRKTELTDLWFVNRRFPPLPPEPFRSLGVKAVTTAMKLDDWWCAR